MSSRQTLRAIDLYSGIGGWSLGLKLSGIEVIGSYEHDSNANTTNLLNNGHTIHTVDIRKFELSSLPKGIDIVVGSPPCTQFSFANRGGSGDINDGLRDIERFFAIVDYLRPKFWAMENVPRLATILEKEIKRGGALWRYQHLDFEVAVYNMADFGLPQKRRRCIAGNFHRHILESYREGIKLSTLGTVIENLNTEPVTDHIFGIQLSANSLRDHVKEPALDVEESRINRAAKVFHSIYNKMSFPDRLDRASRTITATCTRVSRESIVIEDGPGFTDYRRLTLRERASLQSFPITFQFFGLTYNEKLRMIGNAMPPLFSFHIGQAMKGVSASRVGSIRDHSKRLSAPSIEAPETIPPRPGSGYSVNRRFRFAVPTLHFGSAVRFELLNRVTNSAITWRLLFYFGTSKSICCLEPNIEIADYIKGNMPAQLREKVNLLLFKLEADLLKMDVIHMQRVWARKGPGLTRPFMLLDRVDEAGLGLVDLIQDWPTCKSVLRNVLTAFYEERPLAKSYPKLEREAAGVVTGFLIGAYVNTALNTVRRLPDSIHARAAAV